MSLVPYVIEQTARGERFVRYFFPPSERPHRHAERGRKQHHGKPGGSAQLLYLEGQDQEKDISFYINSPGGSITDGMAIYDTMRYIKCDVSTICGYGCLYGVRAAGGRHKGQAPCVAEQRILIHQPLIGGQVGLQGRATDIKIHADHLVRTRNKLNGILSRCTGQPIERIEQDTERDNYMTAEKPGLTASSTK